MRCLPTLIALLAVAAGLPAQDPGDLEHLAQQVEATHRTATAAAVESFRADLRLQELARDADQHRGQVELSVAFREWHKPDTDTAWPLIRYRQADSAHSVEQGRDRKDYWSFADGKLQDMRSREFATDLEHCRRNLRLARQMIKFLDPGAVLHDLVEPSAVTAEDLTQGRLPPIPCYTVSGKLSAFPLRQQGDDLPVLAKAYVARDDHRLVGLQVTPIGDDGAEPASGGEFLRFSEHRLVDGRLVPMRIEQLTVDDDGRQHAQMRIDITTLDLGARLTPEDFDRPQ